MVVSLEDVCGQLEQANLPGTIDEHPNWRRKLPLTWKRSADDARARRPQALHARAAGAAARRRADGRPRRRISARARTGCSSTATSRSTTRRSAGALSRTPRREPLSMPRRICGAAGQHARLRHHRPQRAQPGDRHARGLRALRRGAAQRTAWDRSSTSCPITWASMGADNAWWLDVLENGPASPYADFFDIDWQPRRTPQLAGKVLLPVLGDQYGAGAGARRARSSAFDAEHGEFSVCYYEHRFPIDPRDYAAIISAGAVSELSLPRRDAGARKPSSQRLRAAHSRPLPPREAIADPARRSARPARQGAAQAAPGDARAARCRNPRLHRGARAASQRHAGRSACLRRLHELLERQAYRLAYWRVAGGRDQLPALLRHQRPGGAAHGERRRCSRRPTARARRLLAEGKVDGLRIDHPDGLYDPARLLREQPAGATLERAGVGA